jgi:murein L,D-transpeptidase YcbB/YkuD
MEQQLQVNPCWGVPSSLAVVEAAWGIKEFE